MVQRNHLQKGQTGLANLQPKTLLGKSRKDIARLTATITGHWHIGTHAMKMGLPFDSHCRSCKNEHEPETPKHLLCHSPALGRGRLKFFGKHELKSLHEVGCSKPEPLLKFPSYDSSDVVRGHRVITCVDEGSKVFLVDCVAKISETWNGLKIKIIPARDIPRRPRARIWLPKGQTDHEKLIRTLRVMSLDINTDDWVVLKAEQEMKVSQPFLLLINEECLAQLEAKESRLWYGVRRAKIKVFKNEPPDNILEEVDDTSGFLCDLILEEKDEAEHGTNPVNIQTT